MKEFLETLAAIQDEDSLIDFCRRHLLHGMPAVFAGRENDYYEFRKRIADKFSIGPHEVFIVGSAKLGFSPRKQKYFDLDSDIDTAIVSSKLYDSIMEQIYDYQMQLRKNRTAVSEYELNRYHQFLEYGAIGWMRPDKLPTAFRVKELRQDWFDFFNSISHGKSEVGNYEVSAGVFKSYRYLELYILSDMRSLRTNRQIGAVDV